jgi:YD repeat-containing protein
VAPEAAKPGYGEVIRIDSSNGNFVAFNHDTFGHIIEAYSGDGRRLYYDYDEYGDLIQVTLPDNSKVRYVYKHENDTTTNGTTTTSELVSKHLIIREEKPNGRILENDYDPGGKVVVQRATVGEDLVPVKNAEYVYDSVTRTVHSDDTITGTTLVKDAYNRVGIYEYSHSQLTKITDPLGNIVEQAWFVAGDGLPGNSPRSLRQKKDKRGLTTDFKYDSDGNLVEVKLTGDIKGDGVTTTTSITTFEYDGVKNLVTKQIDPNGNWTETFYENGACPYLPTKVEKHTPSGLISTNKLQYYNVGTSTPPFAKGLLQAETTAWGSADEAVVQYTHSSNGFLTSVTKVTGTSDPNVVTSFRYNLRNELIEQKDSLGRRIVYGYDGLGHRISEEYFNESGIRISWNFSYFNENGEVEWVDGPRYAPEDHTWFKYDGAGRLIEQVSTRSQAKADGTGVEAVPGTALYSAVFHRYDLYGNKTQTIDARKNLTAMTYDDIGQMLSRKSYNGASASGSPVSEESWTYESDGQIDTHTNALGGVTSYDYTGGGQVKHQSKPDGTVLEWRYLVDGRTDREPVNHNTYWDYAYDDYSRTVTRVLKTNAGATLLTESKTFDRRGNVVSETDGEGHTFTATYDDLDRPKVLSGPPTTTSSAQQSVTYTYDASGKTTASTNALGESEVVTKDLLGRPVLSVVKAVGGAVIRQTSYSYAANHHSAMVTQGSGAAAISSTTYTDTFGGTVLTVNGASEKTFNTYDGAGNLVKTKDELGRETTVTYDSLNRPKTTTAPDQATTTLYYDPAGNITKREMPSGLSWNATYDNAGRILTENVAGDSVTTRASTYTYYTSGISKGLLQTRTDARGVTHSTEYDSFLRPNSMLSGGGGTTSVWKTLTYDKRGLVKSAATTTYLPSPLYTEIALAYDGYGNVISETSDLPGQAESTITQKWDAAGRRLSLDHSGATSTAPLYTYTHDADGQLASVNSHGQAFSFTYDTAGLLLSRVSPYRTQIVADRDAAGRILAQGNTVGLTNPWTETMTWRADSTLDTYSVAPGAGGWTQSRSYPRRGSLRPRPSTKPSTISSTPASREGSAFAPRRK